MNGLSTTIRRHIVVLDDNINDAGLLRQLLLSIDNSLVITSHQSNQGIIPQDSTQYQLIFIAQGYAQSDFLPIIQLLQLNQPNVSIALLCDHDTTTANNLMTAGQAGAQHCLDKDQLSTALLRPLIQQNDNSIEANIVDNGANTTADNIAVIDNATIAKPIAVTPSNTTTALDKLGTGVIIFERHQDTLIYQYINQAAADLEHLNPELLINKPIHAADFNYQNFNLLETLQQLGDTPFHSKPVLSLDEQSQPQWREVNISNCDSELVIELHDITAATLATADNAQYDTLWEDLGRSLPAYCLALSEDGLIDHVLAGDWSQLTADSASLSGRNVITLFNNSDEQRLSDQLNKVLNTGKSNSQMFLLDKPEGPLWLQVCVSTLRSAVGLPRRLVLLAHDISEHRLQLNSVAADYQAISEVLQNVPFGVAIKDIEGRYERVNSYFVDLCAEHTANIIGQTDADIFDQELQDTLSTMDNKVRDHGETIQLTMPLPNASNKCRYRVIKTPLLRNSDEPQAIAIITLPIQIVSPSEKNKQKKKEKKNEASRQKQ